MHIGGRSRKGDATPPFEEAPQEHLIPTGVLVVHTRRGFLQAMKKKKIYSTYLPSYVS
jgi:hypothetical protein